MNDELLSAQEHDRRIYRFVDVGYNISSSVMLKLKQDTMQKVSRDKFAREPVGLGARSTNKVTDAWARLFRYSLTRQSSVVRDE
jgi:hypothetical protein